MYEDKILKCRDCNNDFTFSASEQEFYASKGFENEPSRCPGCREINKRQRAGRGGYRGQRELFKATCAKCGKDAEVPFKPTGEKPIYCRDCYQPSRARY